jgi:1,4-alpha-glucan branching enzyme
LDKENKNTNKPKSIKEQTEERKRQIIEKLHAAEKPVNTEQFPKAENTEPAKIEQPVQKISVEKIPVEEIPVEKMPVAHEPEQKQEKPVSEPVLQVKGSGKGGDKSAFDKVLQEIKSSHDEIILNDIKLIVESTEELFTAPAAEPVAEPIKQTEQTVIVSANEPAEKISNNPAAQEQEEYKQPVIEQHSFEVITNNDSNSDTSKVVTDFDAHLFSHGTFYKIFDKFGAQLTNENGIDGARFTTWAPNAGSISIIGEFNGWQEGLHDMARIHESGIWSMFIPNLKEGDTYKFSINSQADGITRRKIDPYAFRSEHRPKDASIIHNINKYQWKDSEWMNTRAAEKDKLAKPMNIYELHLGSWRRDYENKEFPNEWGYLSYGQLAGEIVAYVKKMGYTHIELLPVMEHPLDISWGYQVTHYFAPSSRFGEPDDFMYFVDHCHQNGIGVILDWVPAHFPADDHALAFYDGKQIYAYESWKKGFHKDWNTYVFDYSRPQVQNFLISSALFWLEKYHIDGLRVDAVASMLYLDYSRDQGEWEPNIHGGRENLEAIEFLKHLNDVTHKYHPDVLMIAEESTSWPGVSHTIEEGGLGFDMKWNMGWMNDILLYFSKEPVHRKFHQGKITFSLWYAFSENFVLPISHDEVVHGKKSLLEKMPGDTWQKFANLRLFMGFMFGHPGKKLNFMTTDIAQYNEWNSEQSLEWNLLNLVDMNAKYNQFMNDLNHLYTSHPALYENDFSSDGFHWIDFADALNSVLSFYRISKDKSEIILFTFNMTPTVRNEYSLGVPEAGFWKEIFNSDAEIYGGSGIGNFGGKQSEPVKYKTWENSIKATLPPLALNIYKLERVEVTTAIEPGIANVEDYYVDEDTGGGD